jgi:anti-sigma factor RsiW
MTMHIADNHEALIDYLYEEGDPAERLKIRQHLQECAACSVAVLEFQSVRGMLSDWTPPAANLGFRIVQDASPSASLDHRARGGWSWGWGPTTYKRKTASFLQAAAAILLFVAGMAVSQLHVDYANGALTVHTRSAEPGAAAGAVRNAWIMLPSQNTDGVVPVKSGEPVDLEELERRLLARLQASNVPSAETERTLQRVRSMIDQSEQRQQRELALRLSQASRELDTQREADLLRVQQELGRQHDATLEYLVRTSGGAK